MKHIEEFDHFLRTEVNLDRNRLELLHGRVRDVTEYLSQNLNCFEKRENQGSYALGTVIKPVDGQEYDSDILIYMKDDPKKGAVDYVEDLYDCLRKYPDKSSKTHQRTKCVEVHYADDFHLDVVPCVTRRGQSHVPACNTKTGKFEPTDGTGYREWFNVKADITSGHLKAVTRLC